MPLYMNYEGIFGPVTKEPYKGWIELQSVQFGRTKRTPLPLGVEVSITEIIVSKMTDSSSTRLFNEALQGEGKKVIIDFVKDDGSGAYLRLELEKTLISAYSASSSGNESQSQLETLTLSFTKITYSLKGKASSKGEAAKATEWRSVTAQ
jgi:type VI secretion system secreted protein Hcp